ncbi:MAG: putative transcriptional regulator [Acidimicrobiales bacterium]|nr:putative transcriptional regulator [Acidimicrobiales bacterium]
MQTLIGRDRERDVASTFVAMSGSGPAVLRIDGEPGIGKTSLLKYALALARSAGSLVLECNPTPAENAMSFAALTELLRDVPDDAFGAMPDPQRHSLAVATLREAPAGAPLDERAVGTGLATLLFHLAASRPVIVAIDDLQWIDLTSAGVLSFALRRVRADAIGLMTCERTGERPQAFPTTILSEGWVRALTLTGMSAASLFHVVREQLSVVLARPALLKVTETSGGNPYVAIELARSADQRASLPGGQRVAELLQDLTIDRLDQLSPGARRALLAAACSPRPTVVTMRSLGLLEELEEAESSGTVSFDGDRVVFAHPLLANAVVHMATAPQHREMHRRLAAICTEPESRARHVALANLEPDEATAVALDEATETAEARGSSIAAAELARLALERTVDPDGSAAWTRRIRLGELLHAAGSSLEAAEVLERDGCPHGELRARAGLVLTEVAYQTSTIKRTLDVARGALAEALGNPRLTARCLLSLAAVTTDGNESARYAAEALETLRSAAVHDPALLAWAECEEVSARFHLGEGLDTVRLDHALELERSGRRWRSGDQVAAVRPVLLKWADRPSDALAALIELRDRAEEEGNDGLMPYVLGHIPVTFLRLGRLADAFDAASEHLGHAERTGQESQRMQALYNVAFVASHLGRLDEAARAADEILRWAMEQGDTWLEMSATTILGFVAFSRGDNAGARSWFERWSTSCDSLGIVDPGVSRYHGDLIEALIASGDVEEAARRTDDLVHRAERAGRISALVVAARCRALLAAAGGDIPGALALIDHALELDDSCSVPFERHRTMLVKGLIHRRAKQKAAARQALVAAADGFKAIGAEGWRARCEEELQRMGTRVGSATTLTVTEQMVARLAAAGLTNRQVAEQSFMSPKTVEANLARVYRKLGISSRAELGAHIANEARTDMT